MVHMVVQNSQSFGQESLTVGEVNRGLTEVKLIVWGPPIKNLRVSKKFQEVSS